MTSHDAMTKNCQFRRREKQKPQKCVQKTLSVISEVPDSANEVSTNTEIMTVEPNSLINNKQSTNEVNFLHHPSAEDILLIFAKTFPI